MTLTAGTYSYSGDPVTSKKDQVRFLAGDTNSGDPYLSDEEILYLLAQADPTNTAAQANPMVSTKPYTAAASACFHMSVKAAQRADDEQAGDVKVSATELGTRLGKKAAELADRARLLEGAGPFVVIPIGMDISGGAEDDPYFTSGGMNNPAGDVPPAEQFGGLFGSSRL